MSDNVVPWPARAGQADADSHASIAGDGQVAGGGSGPHDPGMETRVAGLEKAVIRIDAKMDHVALKTDIVALVGRIDTLTERLNGHGETLTKVERAILDLGSKVDAKLISGGQMFAIFGGLMTLFVLLGGIAIGLLEHLGMLH